MTVSNPKSQPLKTKTNKLYEKSDENSYGPQTKTINKVTQSNSTISSDKLSVGSLNVCGLKRRILYTEFTDLVQSFDIFCLSETKLLDTDIISCPGYTFSVSLDGRNSIVGLAERCFCFGPRQS